MAYEGYTKHKKIPKGTRKREYYDVCTTRGERAAVRQNARRKIPNKRSTLRNWSNHMKYTRTWRP